MPIDIKFVALLTPPNFDAAMILRDSDGDHFTLSKLNEEPGGGWGGKFIQGTYLDNQFQQDRPAKLIEVFTCLVDLADVNPADENFLPTLSLPTPGIDNLTIHWATTSGDPLNKKIDGLYAKFRALTGLFPVFSRV